MKKLLSIIVLGLLLGGNAYAKEPYSKILYKDENHIQISMEYDWNSHDNALAMGIKHCEANNKKFAFRTKRPAFRQSKLDKEYKKKGLRPKSHRIFEYICSNEYISISPSFVLSAGEKIEHDFSYYNVNSSNNNNTASSSNSQSAGITFTIKDKKEQCAAIGFKPATDKFADCVLRLVELDLKKQINNPTVVAQDSGNQAIVNELKRSNNMKQSQFLMNLSNQLLNPSSPASSMSSSSCTVRGGAIKKINCW
tara:strand:- start:562 stop:1317 length:756 start_codon:yes stop_codon:yes gene_type:complete